MKSSITSPAALNAAIATTQSVVYDLDGLSGISVQANYTDAAPAAKDFTSETTATGLLDITSDITLTSVAKGTARNTTTFTTEVIAAAANPTNTVLATFTGTAGAIVCTVTPNNGNNNPSSVQAAASVATSTPIVLTSVARGTARNTTTFTTEVLAAAANPTNTVLAAFSGTAAAIVCTVTPNTGANNPANVAASGTATITNVANLLAVTPDTIEVAGVVFTAQATAVTSGDATFRADTGVNETAASLAAQITAHATTGPLVTAVATDAAVLITAKAKGTGGNALTLAYTDGGTDVGATVTGSGTLAGGVTTPITVTTANLVELINTGAITGKTATITDASSLRALQTATGGDTTPMADSGEGDHVVGTFANGTLVPVTVTSANLVELINTGAISGKTATVTDASSLRALQTASGGDTTPLADGGEGDHVIATFSGGLNTSLDLDTDYITISAHGYITGTKVALTTSGGLPTGLSTTNYWAIKVDANTLKLASSLANAVAGTKVNMTTEGTGTHTLTPATSANNVFKLQKSNDNSNFIDVTSASVTIATSPGSSMFEVASPSYRYLKVIYTPSAGQVNLSTIVNQIGG